MLNKIQTQNINQFNLMYGNNYSGIFNVICCKNSLTKMYTLDGDDVIYVLKGLLSIDNNGEVISVKPGEAVIISEAERYIIDASSHSRFLKISITPEYK